MFDQSTKLNTSESLGHEQKPTVLLVEDEMLVAMTAEVNLRELGFEPHAFANAADALQAMADDLGPTLAVIDVGLPDQGGDQLARQLHAAYPALNIIIASGHDDSALRIQFADMAGVSILAKPYSDAELARAVRAFTVP